MSWEEKVNSEMIIQTGDGARYKPFWKNAEKSLDFNIAEFEFPNLAGTLVKRSTPKGRKFPLEIYFQGEDNLDVAESFEKSANDKRPWQVTHPIYGSITVQPISLLFDNTTMNVTKITGTLLETITEDYPRTFINPIDNIGLKKTELDELFTNSLNAPLKAVEVNTLTANVNKFYKIGARLNQVQELGEEYFNLFNKANAAVLNATKKPIEAIRAVQAVINYPAFFKINAKQRVGLLSSQFKSLSELLPTKYAGKKIYEIQGGGLISAMCLAASKPIEVDYESRGEVLDVIANIIAAYNQYCGIPNYADLTQLSYLDQLQANNGNATDSFIPDASSIIALNQLVNFTVANLFDVALGSKQERSIILDEDSNLIVLTHRFYTLDPNDENMERLMAQNNWGINEILQIRKGTTVKYYI